jgi:oligopeptide transport system substrate-binding protein
VVIHNGSEPETIDPQVLSAVSDGRIGNALFEGLVRFDPTNAATIPGLADAWTNSADGKSYTFHIRTNAAWSTGEPITADDFVWSWRRAVIPETASDYSGQFLYLENGEAIYTGQLKDASQLGVQARGRNVLEVRLNNPTPFFIDLLTARIFCVVPRRAIERYGDRWIRSNPLPCSGPYELVDWRLNDRIRLRRNEHYWDAANVRSKTVDVIHGDNANTALNLYLTGAVDFILDSTMIPTDLNDLLAARRDFERFDYLATYFIRFNCTRKPFNDARVRKAFCMSVDRQRIVDRITRLGEHPTTALVPPGAGGYQPPPGLDPDEKQARKLLAEAGYPEGKGFPTVEYAFSTNSKLHEQIGVEIQEMIRQRLGIQLELRPLETKAYYTDMSHTNYDMIRGAWIGDYNDPNTFLDLFLADNGNNRTGWGSKEYDALVQRANATLDRPARMELLRKAETILIRDEAPILCLYNYKGMHGFNPDRLGGIFPNLLDEHPFWSIYRKDGGRKP